MGEKKSLLTFFIAAICCALPLFLIAGGATILVGTVFQEIFVGVIGLIVAFLIFLIVLKHHFAEES